MFIEHSPLKNEFVSFWIETSIDGEHRYDTFIDFMRKQWYICSAGDGPILVRGDFNASLSDDGTVKYVREQVDEALAAGRI